MADISPINGEVRIALAANLNRVFIVLPYEFITLCTSCGGALSIVLLKPQSQIVWMPQVKECKCARSLQ